MRAIAVYEGEDSLPILHVGQINIHTQISTVSMQLFFDFLETTTTKTRELDQPSQLDQIELGRFELYMTHMWQPHNSKMTMNIIDWNVHIVNDVVSRHCDCLFNLGVGKEHFPHHGLPGPCA